jgi:hypothetical protein
VASYLYLLSGIIFGRMENSLNIIKNIKKNDD